MKKMVLVIGLAGVVFVSTGVGLAGDKPATTSAPSPVKKDSGHAIAAPVAKNTAPKHMLPPLLKSGLPVDAGKPRGNAVIGGATSAGGHKDGMLNGTEIKRHP